MHRYDACAAGSRLVEDTAEASRARQDLMEGRENDICAASDVVHDIKKPCLVWLKGAGNSTR